MSRDDPGFWWWVRWGACQVRWWLAPLPVLMLAYWVWAYMGYPR